MDFVELHKILDDAWIRYCTNYRLHVDLVLYNYPGNYSTGTVILDDAWTLWNRFLDDAWTRYCTYNFLMKSGNLNRCSFTRTVPGP